jgi:hypothetical protein
MLRISKFGFVELPASKKDFRKVEIGIGSMHIKVYVMTHAIPHAPRITVSAMVVLTVDKPVLVINCFLQIR